jgi:hypothetical protein
VRQVRQEEMTETEKFILDKGLSRILAESKAHIDAAFGECEKSLLLVDDPEGYQFLSCSVIWHGSLEDARKALQSFDDNWWLDRAGEFSGRLLFDFELA